MTLIEDDDVVQAFSADRADQAFGEGILPGAVRRREGFVDPHALHSAPKLLAVDLVTVAQEIGRRGVVRESVQILWIGCYGKQNIRLIVRIIRGYSKHRVNDAIETLHGLIITQE